MKTECGSNDPVNPSHYKRFPVEPIDILEHLSYNRGSAIKYLVRAGYKYPEKELEDLRKAKWFLEREIQRISSNGLS